MNFQDKITETRKLLNNALDEMEEVYGTTKCLYEIEYKLEPFFQTKKMSEMQKEAIEKKAQEAAQKCFQEKMRGFANMELNSK